MALAATRTRNGQPSDDGPHALALTCNGILHRRGREVAGPIDFAPLIDAWWLRAWFSELAVLRVCGFAGLYRNRLSDNLWAGAVEPGPDTAEAGEVIYLE